jgi:hypothetical protein
MRRTDGPEPDMQRRKAIEDFRINRIGLLLHIIEELDNMGLDVMEMDAVLRSCGLDYKCAMKIGAALRDEKENEGGNPRSQKR